MDSCYSDGHNAGDHICIKIQHVTLRNHKQNVAFGRSVIDYWDALTSFTGIKHSPFASTVVLNIKAA